MDAPSRSKKNLTNEQRQEIFLYMLRQSDGGKLKRGLVKNIAALFSVNMKIVCRIWHRGKACIATGLPVDVSSRIPGKVGRKRVQFDPNQMKEIPLRRRTNIRSLSKALNIPKSTLHKRIKEGMIRSHSNALKPQLSDEHKKQRLYFYLSMLEPASLGNHPVFKNVFNYVHIDEKWFYMIKESEKFYLLPEEAEPHRTCKSKRFITKVMFLAAVARPRFDAYQNVVFSGKIGIFPFTLKELAKRTSKNHLAGTMETKAIIQVNKDLIRSYLIEKVLPAIRSKWPRSSASETIFIQQDNARPHIQPFDVEFLEAATRDGFDIRLLNQPPNSLDLNVLDLGFFRAIQSLQHQEAPTTIDELVHAVEKSFDELAPSALNNVFLTLQSCMIEAMKVYGGNNYKLPHMGKNQLISGGVLPLQLECSSDIVDNTMNYLQQQA